MLAKYYTESSDLNRLFDPFYLLSDLNWTGTTLKNRVNYDVLSDENSLTLIVDLPGVKKEDLRVEASGQTIAIKAKRGKEDYSVSYRLAKVYDASGPDAQLEDGVLTLKFNKTQTTNTKLIEVK